MTNMNGTQIEEYQGQPRTETNVAPVDLFPTTARPENITSQDQEDKPLENGNEPSSTSTTPVENENPSEKPVAPLQFVVGPQITQAQVLNDRRVAINVGKLNGEKLPLAV